MPSPANKVQFSTVPKIALDALNHKFFPTACLHQLDSLVKLSLAGLGVEYVSGHGRGDWWGHLGALVGSY